MIGRLGLVPEHLAAGDGTPQLDDELRIAQQIGEILERPTAINVTDLEEPGGLGGETGQTEWQIGEGSIAP